MATALSPIYSVLSLFLLLCSYDSKVHGDDQGFHVLRMETLMPANVCTISKAPSANSLKVVYRHGPCFPSGDGQPDHNQMLSEDSMRVAYLQSQIQLGNSPANASTDNLGQGLVTLQAQDGRVIGSSSFVLTIGIGTPKRDQTVIFDTGSNLCWVQCMPSPFSYQQREPMFDPSASSSYRNVPFTDPRCTNLPPHSRGALRNNCVYRARYGDSSSSIGLLALETLTLTNTTVIPNFVFGCSHNATGFAGAAGLFGLGRLYQSLISQAPNDLGRVFSYCLPARASISGHLTIGRRTFQSPAYIPMLTSRPSYYFIDLLGITVAGLRLWVPSTVFSSVGTILDSGTTISRLPTVAYMELRNVFRNAMVRYRSVGPIGIMDTCYDVRNVQNPVYPAIVLHFASFTSGSVNLTLKQTQVFHTVGSSVVCLGFAPNNRSSDLCIIGATQQRGMDVIYDLGSRRIGFAAGNCG